MKQRIFSRLKAFLSTIHPTVTAVKMWPGSSQADLARLQTRWNKIIASYSGQYNRFGLLNIPHRLEAAADHIDLYYRKMNTTPIDPDHLHNQVSSAELDLMILTLLAQLEQLESIGVVHGKVDLVSVSRCNAPISTSLSLKLGDTARFADEPVFDENKSVTAYSSPEMVRVSGMPDFSHLMPTSDIFSAACLYYHLLTGRALAAPSGCAPSEALCRLQPVCLDGLRGPRRHLISRMLAFDPGSRPSSTEAIAYLHWMKDLSALPENAPALPIHAGEWVIYEGDDGMMPLHGLHLCSLSGTRFGIARTLPQWWSAPCSNPSDPAALSYPQLRAAQLNRLRHSSQISQQLHAALPTIDPFQLIDNCDPPLAISVMPEDAAAIPLSNAHEALHSIFLLDARMVDILHALQSLHDSGYFLGAMDERNFYIALSSTGGLTHLTDLSSMLSITQPPPGSCICPDRHQLQLLSPELSRYIALDGLPNTAEADDLSPLSDIFTLGLIYHLLLTGTMPRIHIKGALSYGDAVCHAANVETALSFSSCLDAKHRQLIAAMLDPDPWMRPSRCSMAADCILSFYTD